MLPSETLRLKDEAAARVDALRPALVDLSHRIHGHPEVGFEEEQSAAWCEEALAEDLRVSAGVAGLPTAFVAEAGRGELTVGICAEYDALPGIGHACGHNVIAAAAVGAGRILAGLADDLGITVKVFGTPAEEGGGGKIIMLDAGAFDGVHAALMVHPAPMELDHMPCLAVSHFDVDYRGKEAHASAFPEQGINAADAITVAQVAIGLLRQHARPGNQVHGIVTRGGEAPNIVPGRASAKYYVRARTLAELAEWEPRVHRCFHAGAMATGAEVEIHAVSAPYSEMRDDVELRGIYRTEATAIGRTFADTGGGDRPMAGSTDMANVSLRIPTIHPMLGIASGGAVNHQPEFAAACATPSADQAVRDGALAMVRTVIDAAVRADVRARLLAGTPAS